MQFWRRSSQSQVIICIVVVLLAIGVASRAMVGSACFNQANIAAVRTVLIDDRYLPVAVQWHALAQRWLPDFERAAPIVRASLRVADPCLVARENDAILTDTGGTGRVRLALQGHCWWLQGERDKAVQAWRQARVELFLYQWARYDQAQGRLDRALDEYMALLAVDPASMEDWPSLGGLYEAMENWQQAERMYEEAIRVAPDNALAHQSMAFYRVRRGLVDARTEEELQKAISLAPAVPSRHIDLPWLYIDLALRYLWTERPSLAEEAARNAITLNSDLPYAHHFLGDALRAQGDSWGAITAYKKAIAVGGTNAWIHYGLAKAYVQVGDLTNARQEAQQLVTANPQEPAFRLLVDEIEKLGTPP